MISQKKTVVDLSAYPERTVYEGDVFARQPCGQGVLILPSGECIKGTFKKGKLNGFGKRTFLDGGYQEGQFQDGKLHGMGKWRRKGQDGTWWTYEGDFVAGKEDGEGVRINQNNSKYEGQFKEGRWHGKGKTTDFNSGMIENGNYC